MAVAPWRPARALFLWSAGLAATVLVGCVQTLPPQACAPSAQAPQASVRLLVSFRQATTGDAPDILRQLQHHSQACVGYLSSVSPTLHVYSFSGAGDAPRLRQRLLAWSAVLDAVPDERAKVQTPR